MMARNETWIGVLWAGFLTAALSGCSGSSTAPAEPAVIAPTAQLALTLQASLDTNRNLYGRPSPVLVRVFQLAASQAFEQATLSQLSTQPEQTLRTDLLGQEQFLMRPGERLDFRFKVPALMRRIGVIAEYRDVEGVQWRTVATANPDNAPELLVSIGRSAVEITALSSIEQQSHE